jgi:multidrug resistance efflux pump
MTNETVPTVEIPAQRPRRREERTFVAAAHKTRRGGRFRSFLRVVRTTLVVLVLLAAAVAGGRYVIRDRLAARAFVELPSAVLTAQPIPVGSASAGVVSAVRVTPQSQVTAGQELARVTVTGPDGKPDTEVLKAPTTGVVSAVNVAAGGVATPGQQIITLYDPTQLTFQAKASLEQLRRLRLGMAATIDAKGLSREISARLDRVVPLVGSDKASGSFTIVLVPAATDMDVVRSLVPGLPFTATVDTNTATDGTPAINSAR